MGEDLYHILLAVVIAFCVILFVAKLRFDKIYEKREERRRMLSYSKSKLSPTEEGQMRALRIKRVK
ncbi:MAG: hypothetical protein FWC15_02025 [Fibromonadales bacterium]|nr:hypothetical protein [Fibromonadales bacterium]